MRTKWEKIGFFTLTIFLILSLLCNFLLLLWVFSMKKEEEESLATFQQEIQQAEQKQNDILSAQEKAQLEKEQLEKKITAIESEKDALQKKLQVLSEKSSQVESLLSQIEELKTAITAKEQEIERLKKQLLNHTNPLNIDLNQENDLTLALTDLLNNQAPMRQIAVPVMATQKKEIRYQKPKIALYYEDLTNGFHFSYQENMIFYSASLIKAPYILSILEDAAASENKYDFTKTFTYTSAAYKEGSGKIKNQPQGTVYTYQQLIQYALEYSDNVAYAQLRKAYGYTPLMELSGKLGVTSVVHKVSDITATDAMKYLKEIYSFTQTDFTYGKLLKDSMMKANHTVMIPYSVLPTQTAHKYGWDVDAYHDMAIVYGEHPYALVVLTDLDTGDTITNQYIQKIVKIVNQIHQSLYAA